MRKRPAIRLKDSTCWPPEGIPGLTGDEVCLVLTKGYVSLVDAEDAIDLQQFMWCAQVRDNRVYPARRCGVGNALLHREILKPPQDREVDHLDQHRFFVFKIVDNRRANLRIVTGSQNQANRRKNRDSVSRYKGVCWHARVRRWYARIRINGKLRYLGLFDNELDAANAYDAAHAEYYPSITEGTNAHMMKQAPETKQAAAV